MNPAYTLRMTRKPKALRTGDAVAVVAPASPADPAAVERGIARLEAMGLRVVRGRHLAARRGYLAGTDAERAGDLMAALTDPVVRAVFCVRGGYGTPRLLDRLDYAALAPHPKIVVGYSDVTALLLALHRRAGWVVFHGPLVAPDLGAPTPSAYTLEHLRRALFLPAPLGRVEQAPGLPPPVVLRPGVAAGRLTGGNLSLVAATLGTSDEVRTRGRILFLEDVGEAPYRVDRLLTHLGNAGRLDGVAGIAYGEMEEGILEVLAERLGGLGVPVLAGLAIGHGGHKATLPLGVRATLDASEGFLRVEEAAVT